MLVWLECRRDVITSGGLVSKAGVLAVQRGSSGILEAESGKRKRISVKSGKPAEKRERIGCGSKGGKMKSYGS